MSRAALAFLALLVTARSSVAGPTTYLALGDSITFGVGSNDTATDTSNGDRGYVGLYADFLKTQTGTRPTVINLAVSGETSSSFFGNGVSIDGPGASLRNTNYIGTTLPSQDALMLSTIAAQPAGNPITNVTISLGANDLFYALATGGSFTAALATYQAYEMNLLGQVQSLLPTARVELLGYFDPYAPFAHDPTNPQYPIAVASAQVIPIINSLIQADAQAFGASYVDTFPLFVGKELSDTYIASGNVHPTPEGYQLIATAVESVPEPTSCILVGLGCGGAMIVSRARRGGRSAATG